MMHLPYRRSTRHAVIGFVLLYAIAILGFVFLVYLPSQAELARIRTSSQVNKGTLNSLLEMRQRNSEAVAEHAATIEKANNLWSQFPRERNVSNILSAIQDMTRANRVSLERLDYARIAWKDGIGSMQMTALLTGDFPGLAKTLIQLPEVLPTVHVDDFRIKAVSHSGLSANAYPSENLRDAGGIFPGLSDSPLVKALTSSMQITAATIAEEPTVNLQVSPLDIDHLEVNLKLTIWLIEEPARIGEGNNSGWHVRPPQPLMLPANSPFKPSSTARDVIEKKALAEKLQKTQVKAIVKDVQGRFLASIWVLGKPYVVKVGDSLLDLTGAKVTAIKDDRVLLSIQGLEGQITLSLGGTQQ